MGLVYDFRIRRFSSFPAIISFILFAILSPLFTSSVAADGPPDPNCARGIQARGACCKSICGKCGGFDCYRRSRLYNTRCCPEGIKIPSFNVPFCTQSGPPCRIGTNGGSNGGGSPSSLNGRWKIATVQRGALSTRHEACAVFVNGLVLLIGGRGVNKEISVFNTATRIWTTRNGPGANVEMHHMQCVVAGGKVWIPTSWKGGYPREKNNNKVYVYDVKKDQWSTRPGMKESRQRGGAASVVRGQYIYVVGGNRGGHGAHAKSLPWMDAFNWKTGRWLSGNLPNMPDNGRDHVGGALVKGQLCIAGGRNGGSADFFNKVITSTYCYNFGKRTWVLKKDIPQGRGGAATGTACDGNMVIAGGEGFGKAFSRVDTFDGVSWKQGPSLATARHGSGLAVAGCSCGYMYIPSGSGRQGGAPELRSMEQFVPAKTAPHCN